MLRSFECAWDHHGRGTFENHTVKELLEHLLDDTQAIRENQESEMQDLTGIQADEQALGAAQSQEATDVLQALSDLEAKVNSGAGVTQADIDALRGPLQAALGVAQSTDAAAQAADATINPPAGPGTTNA